MNELKKEYCKLGNLCPYNNPPVGHIHLTVNDIDYVLEIFHDMTNSNPEIILKRIKKWHCRYDGEINNMDDINTLIKENIEIFEKESNTTQL